MAMPASGSLGIISAPQACGSICAAVGITSGSLSALSVAATPPKTAPHSMLEFYGYVPGLAIRVDTQWVGTCGSGNGMCGQVYLKCSTTVICSGSIIAWEQGECQFNWYPPTGTYCVKWCNFCATGGFINTGCINWSRDNPTASGCGITNVITSSFSASGCIQGCVCPSVG